MTPAGPLLAVSAAAWLLLAAEATGMALPAICSAAALSVPSAALLDLALKLNPPASLLAGWALMLAAMMAPLLTAPMSHIRDRSFAQRRGRAIALFVAGYAASWLAAGIVLLALAMAVLLAAPGSALPLALAAIVALVWQVSPAKQRCLNRCHAKPALAAFGSAADLGALRFGLTHGVWCVGACWALMLLPFLVERGHVAAMAAVALWLFAERLDRSRPPAWRWRGPGKAVRIAVVQSRLRLHRLKEQPS